MLNLFDIARQTRPDEFIVEIGAGYGETTIELLKIAKEIGTKVIAVDPFESGWETMPGSYRYSYDRFHDRVKDYMDYLILIKCNSLSKVAEQELAKVKIGFAYIDGLQYKGALLNDLRITDHARVQCLDDANRETVTSEVISTLQTYKTTKKLIIDDRWAYLTR